MVQVLYRDGRHAAKPSQGKCACPVARVLLALGLVTVGGCAPVLTTGPNAVGVHYARTSYDAQVPASSADDVDLADASGVLVSYGRRCAGGRRLWLGPEVMLGFTGQSELTAPRTNYPAGGWIDELLYRTGLDVGIGLACARYSESERLLSGVRNVDRCTDDVCGPVTAFGLDLRINEHFVLRADFHYLSSNPDLSFPWPDRAATGSWEAEEWSWCSDRVR